MLLLTVVAPLRTMIQLLWPAAVYPCEIETIDKLYLAGTAALELLLYVRNMEFLPLMLTSMGCAVGILWSWVMFLQTNKPEFYC